MKRKAGHRFAWLTLAVLLFGLWFSAQTAGEQTAAPVVRAGLRPALA